MSTDVLHVIARMNVGGTARYIADLLENIPNVKLATGYVQDFEIEDPYISATKVIRIPHLGRKISIFNDLKAWIELRKVVKLLKPKIIHTHTFKAGLIGRLIPGKHVRIHTFHGHLFTDQSFSPFQKFLITVTERVLAKRTQVLVTVGEKVGEDLRAMRIGIDRNWISLPPGVKEFSMLEKEQARTSLGLEQNVILFGWMARMAPVKNPYLLLEIARSLKSVKFVVAGGGELIDDVRAKAPPNVKVIGWVDASTFWSAIDVALSTSDNEGMPIALIEAQLAGIPVIATDVGSTSEVIENQITGIITNRNLPELIVAVVEMNTHPELIRQFGSAGRRRAKSRFSHEKFIERHINLYEKFLRLD